MMTAKELVAFAESKIGTNYVYGMKGQVMTAANFNYLYEKYNTPTRKMVPYSDSKKVGTVCVDCSGLISWACGIKLSSSGWHDRAERYGTVNPISTIKEAPVGALVWKQGHIGVYAGMEKGVPYYIAADSSKDGTRKAPMSANNFTHWMTTPDFIYEEDDEVVEKDKVIYKDKGSKKNVEVEMIRKDGYTFIKTRDLKHFGLKVSSEGKTPVLERE